jgi:hypothetical protein
MAKHSGGKQMKIIPEEDLNLKRAIESIKSIGESDPQTIEEVVRRLFGNKGYNLLDAEYSLALYFRKNPLIKKEPVVVIEKTNSDLLTEDKNNIKGVVSVDKDNTTNNINILIEPTKQTQPSTPEVPLKELKKQFKAILRDPNLKEKIFNIIEPNTCDFKLPLDYVVQRLQEELKLHKLVAEEIAIRVRAKRLFRFKQRKTKIQNKLIGLKLDNDLLTHIQPSPQKKIRDLIQKDILSQTKSEDGV